MTEYLDKWDGDIIRALRFQDEQICELAADEIERLSEVNEMMLTDIRRTDVDMLAFKAEIERLRAEVQTWQGHAKTAIWSDSEECKFLTSRIAQLEAALRPFACECVGFCKDAKHNYGEVEPIETCKYGRNRAALGEERT